MAIAPGRARETYEQEEYVGNDVGEILQAEARPGVRERVIAPVLEYGAAVQEQEIEKRRDREQNQHPLAPACAGFSSVFHVSHMQCRRSANREASYATRIICQADRAACCVFERAD